MGMRVVGFVVEPMAGVSRNALRRCYGAVRGVNGGRGAKGRETKRKIYLGMRGARRRDGENG